MMKTSITALALATLMVAGTASATSIHDLDAPGVDRASAMLVIDGTTASLVGDVNGFYEKEALERAALKLEGIEKVRNFLDY